MIEPCVSCAAKDVEIGTLKEQLLEKEKIIHCLTVAVWGREGKFDPPGQLNIRRRRGMSDEFETMQELLKYPVPEGLHPNEARWRQFARELNDALQKARAEALEEAVQIANKYVCHDNGCGQDIAEEILNLAAREKGKSAIEDRCIQCGGVLGKECFDEDKCLEGK